MALSCCEVARPRRGRSARRCAERGAGARGGIGAQGRAAARRDAPRAHRGGRRRTVATRSARPSRERRRDADACSCARATARWRRARRAVGDRHRDLLRDRAQTAAPSVPVDVRAHRLTPSHTRRRARERRARARGAASRDERVAIDRRRDARRRSCCWVPAALVARSRARSERRKRRRRRRLAAGTAALPPERPAARKRPVRRSGWARSATSSSGRPTAGVLITAGNPPTIPAGRLGL